MRPVVDESTCIGCELCVDTCPDVFEMRDGVSHPIVDAPDDAQLVCAEEAADICPTSSITLTE